MNAPQHDRIPESLDRLAGLADSGASGDRMPDIRRRVRATRRRQGAAVVAAVVLAVGGVGLWQVLPGESTVGPAIAPDDAPRQELTIDARPARTGQVRVAFTVTGEATEYADPETGEPAGYAGPANTEVLVDGRTITGSDGGDLACEPGGELTSYSQAFFEDDPLLVAVPPGDHTVVVRAPYCADGEIVESTESVVVRTALGAEDSATVDSLRVDLDADGEPDDVRLRDPADPSNESIVVEVSWGSGETTSAGLPDTMTWGLEDPRDLDDDGDLEVVAFGGGGEYGEYAVFQADPDQDLRRVETVDADGSDLLLGTDGEGWSAVLEPEGLVSYRLVDPEPDGYPAPADVREWTLAGTTLTRSAETTRACVTLQPRFEIGGEC